MYSLEQGFKLGKPGAKLNNMSDIQQWLKQFKKAWKTKDTDQVLKLFTEDVKYHETPTRTLEPSEIEQEWQTINKQQNIQLETTVFSAAENKHTVQFNLSYYREDGEKVNLKGIYLIKLNSKGKCKEFWQYCQSE
jgi:ketosteroid isomerase-like protein